MDLPKLWKRRSEFEMTTEAFKTRLMRKSLAHEMEVFIEIVVRRRSNVEQLALSAFLTTDLNPHTVPTVYDEIRVTF